MTPTNLSIGSFVPAAEVAHSIYLEVCIALLLLLSLRSFQIFSFVFSSCEDTTFVGSLGSLLTGLSSFYPCGFQFSLG
jgi:hypothetical protein